MVRLTTQRRQKPAISVIIEQIQKNSKTFTIFNTLITIQFLKNVKQD